MAADFAADMPIDLASLYALKGGVDLGTLSELAKSVGVADDGSSECTRSKRTCVRVRQEISKLQEILNDDVSDSKTGKPSGRSRGRGSAGAPGRSSLGANRSVEFDDDALSSGSGLLPPAKKKRSSYSQFTHKRRKRKKKQPDDGK